MRGEWSNIRYRSTAALTLIHATKGAELKDWRRRGRRSGGRHLSKIQIVRFVSPRALTDYVEVRPKDLIQKVTRIRTASVLAVPTCRAISWRRLLNRRGMTLQTFIRRRESRKSLSVRSLCNRNFALGPYGLLDTRFAVELPKRVVAKATTTSHLTKNSNFLKYSMAKRLRY